MKIKKNNTLLEQFQNPNCKIVGRCKIDTPNTNT